MSIPATKTKYTLDSLEFVRLYIPRLIPVELIESVKGRTFSPEQFYVYQELQVGNPNNFLYALIDTNKIIHGFLWAETNALDNTLFIDTFSVNKAYWGKGKAIDKAVEFVTKLQLTTQSPVTLWITSNPKFFAKHGFRQSRSTLMEYRHPAVDSAYCEVRDEAISQSLPTSPKQSKSIGS